MQLLSSSSWWHGLNSPPLIHTNQSETPQKSIPDSDNVRPQTDRLPWSINIFPKCLGFGHITVIGPWQYLLQLYLKDRCTQGLSVVRLVSCPLCHSQQWASLAEERALKYELLQPIWIFDWLMCTGSGAAGSAVLVSLYNAIKAWPYNSARRNPAINWFSFPRNRFWQIVKYLNYSLGGGLAAPRKDYNLNICIKSALTYPCKLAHLQEMWHRDSG